ncbi:hypothetical protein BDZ97DRAFT_1759300 [Flammula alnicola]|nr:hypothetical protein BDZ97DRAFT_1759300 [Flammula alnicola]
MNQIPNLDHGLLNVAPSLVVGVWMDLETKSKFFQFPSTTTAHCTRLEGYLATACLEKLAWKGLAEEGHRWRGASGVMGRTLTAKWHIRVIAAISSHFPSSQFTAPSRFPSLVHPLSLTSSWSSVVAEGQGNVCATRRAPTLVHRPRQKGERGI